MQKIIYILLTVGLMSTSCTSTYYFSTISSTNTDVKQVDNGDFLFEDERLWIAYSFEGNDALMRITVFNKSEKPLYIDWDQSALSFANKTYKHVPSDLVVESFNIVDHTIFDTEGKPLTNVKRSSKFPDNISVVPPHCMVSHTPIRLNLITTNNIPKNEYTKSSMANKDNEQKEIEVAKFEENNTPLKFKSFLSIYAKDEAPKRYIQEFYMKSLVKTKNLSPSKINQSLYKRGDWFYVNNGGNGSGDYSLFAGGNSAIIINSGKEQDVILINE